MLVKINCFFCANSWVKHNNIRYNDILRMRWDNVFKTEKKLSNCMNWGLVNVLCSSIFFTSAQLKEGHTISNKYNLF